MSILRKIFEKFENSSEEIFGFKSQFTLLCINIVATGYFLSFT